MAADLEIAGPVGLRRVHLTRACEEHVGHEHNYDHTTMVIRGRVRVLYRFVGHDGQEVVGETAEYGVGEDFFVRAAVRHTIVALEDGTLYVCIFSHRDFGGVVVEKYEASLGNQQAYL